jgi:hypothetical protein
MTAAALVALLALAAPDTLTVGEYRDRLDAIRSAVDAGDLDAARARASTLLSSRIRHEGGEFSPDPTRLRPVADARDLAAARDAARSLAVLRDALGSVPSAAPARPDAELLERLRREEAERALDPGAKVAGPQLHAPAVPRSLAERIRELWDRLWEAIGDVVKKIFRWLARMLFGSMAATGGSPGMTYLVLGLILAVVGVVGILAYLAMQRRKAAEVPAVPAAAPAARDEDPLSRTANEWERFASDLMGSGRFRESIRAWYHAVLVTLFRSGQLHYRKDRTNWEYAYALGPELPWRPGFVEATRTFEQVWYGRRESPREAAEAYASGARDILERLRGGRHP